MNRIQRLRQAMAKERARFDEWWGKTYKDDPDWLNRQCFEAGFQRGCKATLSGVLRLLALIGCGVLVIGLAGLFSGCQDRYRYPCQNPDNFHSEQCQKPKCQFTQQCPEYLVAPILEKQIEQSKPASEAAPQR